MKKLFYFICLFISLNVFSQKADITSAIIAIDNQKDLESAKKWIDVATNKIDFLSILLNCIQRDQMQYIYFSI